MATVMGVGMMGEGRDGETDILGTGSLLGRGNRKEDMRS